jgi:hypothetical protein
MSGGRRTVAVLAALAVAAGGVAAAAHADDAPPGTTVIVTVTTPVTAPPPDPAPHKTTPKPQHAPAPKAKPVVKSHATPRHTFRPPVVVHNAPAAPTVVVPTRVAQRPVVVQRLKPKTTPRTHSKAHTTRRHAKPKAHAKPKVHAKPKAKPTVALVPRVRKHVITPARVSAATSSGNSSSVLLFALPVLLVLLSAVGLLSWSRRGPRRAATAVGPTSAATGSSAHAAERTATFLLEPETVVAEPEPSPELAPVLDAYESSPRELHCQITAWRGYTKWRFYGRVEADGEAVSLVESPAFRAPGTDVPEATAAAKEALAELTERLEADGWQRAEGIVDHWFDAVFVRADVAEPSRAHEFAEQGVTR